VAEGDVAWKRGAAFHRHGLVRYWWGGGGRGGGIVGLGLRGRGGGGGAGAGGGCFLKCLLLVGRVFGWLGGGVAWGWGRGGWVGVLPGVEGGGGAGGGGGPVVREAWGTRVGGVWGCPFTDGGGGEG